MPPSNRIQQIDREVRRRARQLVGATDEVLALAQQNDVLTARIASLLTLANDQATASNAMATLIDAQAKSLAAQQKSIADQKAIIDQQAAIMTALQSRLTVEEQATANDATRLMAIEASYLKRFQLPDWSVPVAANLLSILAAGNRTYVLTLAASLGVKAGAPIFATPKGAVSPGYIVGAASAPADNRLEIQIGNPLIAIGGSMTILLSVFTLRP